MDVFNTKDIRILDMSSNKITNVSTKTKDDFDKILSETQNNDLIQTNTNDSKSNISKFEKFISNVESDFKEHEIADNNDTIKNKLNTTNKFKKFNSNSEVENKVLLDTIGTNQLKIKEEEVNYKSKDINVFENKINNIKNNVQNLVCKVISNESNLTDVKINELTDKIFTYISQSGLLTLNDKSTFVQGIGNKQNIQGKYNELSNETVKTVKQEIAESIRSATEINDNKINTNNKVEILTNNISNKTVSLIISNLVLENIIQDGKSKATDNIKLEQASQPIDNVKIEDAPKVIDSTKIEESLKVTDSIKFEEVPKSVEGTKTEEIPKAIDSTKIEEPLIVTDNIKLGEVPKVVESIKAKDVPKALNKIKEVKASKVTDNIKVDDVLKTDDNIKVDIDSKVNENYEIQISLESNVSLKDLIPYIKNQIKELVTNNMANQTNLTDEKINDLSKQIIKSISEASLINISNIKGDTVQSNFKLKDEIKQSLQGEEELKPKIKLEAEEKIIIQNIKKIISSSVEISSDNLENKDVVNKGKKISSNIAKKIVDIVRAVPVTADKLLSNYNDITYETKFTDQKINDLADEVVRGISESELLDFGNLKLPDTSKDNSKLKEEVSRLIPFVQIEIIKQMITDSIKDVIKDNIKVTTNSGNIKDINDSYNKEKFVNNITQKIIDIVSVIPSITKNIVSNDDVFVLDKDIPTKGDLVNKNKTKDGIDKVIKTVATNDSKVIESISKAEKQKTIENHKNDIYLEKLKTDKHYESNFKSEELKAPEYYKSDIKLEKSKASEYHEGSIKSERTNIANDTINNTNTLSAKGEPFNDNLKAEIMDNLKAAASKREDIVIESKPEGKENNEKTEKLVNNISEVETLDKNKIKPKNNDSNSGFKKHSSLNVSKEDNLIQNVKTKVDRQGIENHIEYKMQVSTTDDTTKIVSKEEKLLTSLADPNKEKSESVISKNNNKMNKVFNFLSQFERVAPENKVVQAPEKYNINKSQFVDDMIKNFKYMDKNGTKEMTVKIVPKELGEVVIKLTMEGNFIKASVTATNKETYNLLNSNLHEIVNKLTNENMKIQSFNINLYNGDTAFLSQNSDNHNFSGQQDRRNSSNTRTNDINTNIEVHSEEVHEQNNINILA